MRRSQSVYGSRHDEMGRDRDPTLGERSVRKMDPERPGGDRKASVAGDENPDPPCARRLDETPREAGTILGIVMAQDQPGTLRQTVEQREWIRRPARIGHRNQGRQAYVTGRGAAVRRRGPGAQAPGRPPNDQTDHEASMSEPRAPDEALAQVLAEIAAAAKAAGRAPGDARLVAVTKMHGPDRIEPTLRAGQRHFGENRVQEAAGKWPALREAYPDIELHLIGPLQTNKVRDAVRLFDVIETVDRPKLAVALAAEMDKTGRRPRLYVQVNTGAEPQKAGAGLEDLDALLGECRALGLQISGLMCIPPIGEDPRPHFETLARLADAHGLPVRSMGMSGDFPAAIAAGATHVRVGSAIFGERG